MYKLETFSPAKHNLYITNIHVSFRETVYILYIGMFLMLTLIQIYTILRRILTRNNNFTFYTIIIDQLNFSRVNSTELCLKAIRYIWKELDCDYYIIISMHVVMSHCYFFNDKILLYSKINSMLFSFYMCTHLSYMFKQTYPIHLQLKNCFWIK